MLKTSAFDRNTSDRKIYVPSCSANLYKLSGEWRDYANDIIGEDLGEIITYPKRQIWYTTTDRKSINLSDAINSFGANIVSHTYENGKGVITFDGDVTKIGWEAFYNQDRLETVTLPSEVTLIDYGAFQDCSKLIGINIGNNVTEIGVNAFENCVLLYSVVIPDSVTKLHGYSFSRSGLAGVIIGKNVKSMGEHTFQNCYNMSLYCKPTEPPTIESNTFTLATIMWPKKIYVPSSYVGAYKTAENWKYFASIIEGYNE